MGSGFAKKKKEARMLQQRFSELQEKLKDLSVTGTSGNGLVSVTMNSDHEITSLKIKPECVDPEDVEGLEDLIRAAHNDAVKKLEKETSTQFPGGMPPMGGLGF